MASAAAGGGGRPEVGGAAGGMRHLGLAFTYNTLLVEYVLSKPDAEKDVGRTRLAQMMYQFSASVLSKITSNKAFMYALSILRESNMQSEWNRLMRLRDLINGLGEKVMNMRRLLQQGRGVNDDFEFADTFIKMIIEELDSNYSAFFPKQAHEGILSANLYGNLLNNSRATNIVMHLPEVPRHDPGSKGGRRRRTGKAKTKRRRNRI
jgi:hypothetical protein